MHIKRLKVAIVLALALLLVVALSAFAAPDAAPERVNVRVRNVNIPWTYVLSSDLCSGIPPGYVISPDDHASNRRKRAIVQDLPNGDRQIKVWDIVTGTASDNFGNAYEFKYRNNIVVNFDGSIATLRMTDSFVLRGEEVSHRLGFKWIWQYYADSLNLIEEYDSDTLANVFPDFPTFPTDDGVTETSNMAYVPGSWQVVYEFGQPFGCDPL